MINSERIDERLKALANIGGTEEGGVTRLALSNEYRDGLDLVKAWMEQAGMTTRLDSAANLIGRREGLQKDAKPIVIGSHFDTVSNGGKYDGTIGVIGGIEVVQHIAEENININRPIEVIAFSEEEGSRFGSGVFGSRAMTGTITEEDLEKQDKDGITRRRALIEFGQNPDEIFNQIKGTDEFELYLEMHIEQGPVLEKKDIPVGIVTGIVGMLVLEITLEGASNHAGTTPMDMRHDALLGASEIALELEKICRNSNTASVGTVGSLNVFPGEVIVVPGQVKMSVDIRDLSLLKIGEIEAKLQDFANEISKKRGLTISYQERMRVEPALSSEKVIDVMKEKSREMELNFLEMASGGGHDAQLMAKLTDIGMIFVRSKNGSHNPKEFASVEDITRGTDLLSRVAIDYLNK